MPRLDGTGPTGMGPMTGGARGLCSPYSGQYAGYGAYPRPHPFLLRSCVGAFPRAYGSLHPRGDMGRGRRGGGRGRGRGR